VAKTIIFLCRCFGEIGAAIDLDHLGERVKEDGAVVATSIVDSLCLPEDIKNVASLIRESGAEKVVIGGCSPFGRADFVISGLTREGIERENIGIVDLREACSWIHRDDPQGAVTKAWNLLAMETGALEHRKRSEDAVIKVRPEVMIIGAGPAGLAAARSLIRLGIRVHLIERGGSPGGMLNLISHVYPSGESAGEKIAPYVEEIEKNTLAVFYPKAKITSFKGFAGDFKVTLNANEKEHYIRVGAVIIASGARTLLPYGLYRYGNLKNVITQMELERQFIKGTVNTRSAVFIQCAGARNHDRPYCATICCPSSLKNAMRVMEELPGAKVFVLHRDIMTPGSVMESYYRKTLSQGVQFIRFEESTPPVVLGEDQVRGVEVYDAINGVTRKIDADLVVLSTPLVPNEENRKLADMLNLQLDRYGFFSEIYPLHPLETRIDGVFICGSARWPVSSDQAIVQGEGAAIKAASLLAGKEISALSLSRVPGVKTGHATVSKDSCTGCGNCVSVCTFEACRLQKIDGNYISRVNKMRCKACGNCVAVCPNGTMQLPEINYRATGEMIRRAFGDMQ